MSATISKAITAVYVGMYNRAADLAGYNWWLNGFGGDPNAPVTAQQMQSLAAGFANNAYFTTAYPQSMSSTDFINQLYINIGGNSGDSAGIHYWEERLETLGADRPAMVAEFIYGFISIDLSSQGNLSPLEYLQAKQRQDSLLNKISVSESFRDLLGSHSNPTETDPVRLDQDPTFQLSRHIIADVDYEASSVDNAVVDIRSIAEDKASATPVFDDKLNDAVGTTGGWALATQLSIDTDIIGSVGARVSASETDHSDLFTFVAPRDGTITFDFTAGGYNEAVFRAYATNVQLFSNQLVEFPAREEYLDVYGNKHLVGSGPVFAGETIGLLVQDARADSVPHEYSIDMWMV